MSESKSSSPETAHIIFASTTLVLIMVTQPTNEKWGSLLQHSRLEGGVGVQNFQNQMIKIY